MANVDGLGYDRDKNLGSDSVVVLDGYSFAIVDKSPILTGQIWAPRKIVLPSNRDTLTMSLLRAVGPSGECSHSEFWSMKEPAAWGGAQTPCRD